MKVNTDVIIGTRLIKWFLFTALLCPVIQHISVWIQSGLDSNSLVTAISVNYLLDCPVWLCHALTNCVFVCSAIVC